MLCTKSVSAVTCAVFSPYYHITLLQKWLLNSASKEDTVDIQNQDCITGGRGGDNIPFSWSNSSSLPKRRWIRACLHGYTDRNNQCWLSDHVIRALQGRYFGTRDVLLWYTRMLRKQRYYSRISFMLEHLQSKFTQMKRWEEETLSLPQICHQFILWPSAVNLLPFLYPWGGAKLIHLTHKNGLHSNQPVTFIPKTEVSNLLMAKF